MKSVCPAVQDIEAAFSVADDQAQEEAQRVGQPSNLNLYRALAHAAALQDLIGSAYHVSAKPGKRGLEITVAPLKRP